MHRVRTAGGLSFCFPERQKQEVFVATSRDGFTVVRRTKAIRPFTAIRKTKAIRLFTPSRQTNAIHACGQKN